MMELSYGVYISQRTLYYALLLVNSIIETNFQLLNYKAIDITNFVTHFKF